MENLQVGLGSVQGRSEILQGGSGILQDGLGILHIHHTFNYTFTIHFWYTFYYTCWYTSTTLLWYIFHNAGCKCVPKRCSVTTMPNSGSYPVTPVASQHCSSTPDLCALLRSRTRTYPSTKCDPLH